MTERTPIKDEELVIHFLNVGRGDTIIIEFPTDQGVPPRYGIVDCYDYNKTARYLNQLSSREKGLGEMEFLCATHPHSDHILGIPKLVHDFRPKEFWDSGFRHRSQTYERILDSLNELRIRLVRVSSGMEWYFGKVRITALAPSVMLRNTYATYGVDVNNASIVLRLEHHSGDTVLMQSIRYANAEDLEKKRRAPRSTVILSGDAEFDSWAVMNEEFPERHTTSENNPLVKKMINMLDCTVFKVAHHGSMHSMPLEVLERMSPSIAIISSEQITGTTRKSESVELTRTLFPHPSTIAALKETCGEVLSTDGEFDWPEGVKNATGNPGSIVIAIPPGGTPRVRKLEDTRHGKPEVVDMI